MHHPPVAERDADVRDALVRRDRKRKAGPPAIELADCRVGAGVRADLRLLPRVARKLHAVQREHALHEPRAVRAPRRHAAPQIARSGEIRLARCCMIATRLERKPRRASRVASITSPDVNDLVGRENRAERKRAALARRRLRRCSRATRAEADGSGARWRPARARESRRASSLRSRPRRGRAPSRLPRRATSTRCPATCCEIIWLAMRGSPCIGAIGVRTSPRRELASLSSTGRRVSVAMCRRPDPGMPSRPRAQRTARSIACSSADDGERLDDHRLRRARRSPAIGDTANTTSPSNDVPPA